MLRTAFLRNVVCTVGFFALVSSAGAALPSLGQASQYAVYGGTTELLINTSGTVVNGNVALGPSGTFNFIGGTINGNFYSDAGSTLNIAGGTQIVGGQFPIDPLPIRNDAQAAADAAQALLATQTFNTLGSQTIFGNGGLNVINVTTNVLLGNGGMLTLMGNGSDEFLFNVNGSMTMTGASSINLINVSPQQVLWNFVGNGSEVLIENSASVGNILAVDRDIRFEGGSNVGSLISNGSRIKLQDGATITAIPEPATGMFVLVSLGLVVLIRRSNLS